MGVFALVLFALLVLNLRIVYITAKNGDNYAKQVLSQKQYDSRTIPYKRGEIQDRNGNVLAKSEKVYNVILDCKAVNSGEKLDLDYVEPTVDALVKTLGIDETQLRSLISSDETKDSQYQILKKKITLQDKQAFEDYTEVVDGQEYTKTDLARRKCVQGVWFEEGYIRSYPMKTLASNVIGFSKTSATVYAGWNLITQMYSAERMAESLDIWMKIPICSVRSLIPKTEIPSSPRSISTFSR